MGAVFNDIALCTCCNNMFVIEPTGLCRVIIELIRYLLMGSATIICLVVLIITQIPKLEVGTPIPPPAADIDWTYYARIVFISFMTIFSFIGLGGVGAFYVFLPIYAVPEK